jgi:predicted amidohydrolase
VAQFPVSRDVSRNVGYISRLVAQAALRGAKLVHFPECAVTGYASKDFESLRGLDWAAIRRAEGVIAEAASHSRLWVAYGTYRGGRPSRPYNSLRVVGPEGRCVAQYDEINLYGKNGERRMCTAGRRLKVVRIAGIRCGLLICNDSNEPSLYEAYRRRRARLLLHSYYSARNSRGKGVFDDVIVGQLRTRAFDHGLWISASNSSARYSCLPSCIAAPDGTSRRTQPPRHGDSPG